MKRVAAVLVKIQRQIEMFDGYLFDEPRFRVYDPGHTGMVAYSGGDYLFPIQKCHAAAAAYMAQLDAE